MTHDTAMISLKRAFYAQLHRELEGLLEEERDFIANAANTSALIHERLPGLNWTGFYILKGEELVLGPFQGRAACVRIALGKGVCGTAAAQRQTVIVDNVHEFPGHITCDTASNSEIVVPIVHDGDLIGVLDIDSPIFNRFDEHDRTGLETLVATFVRLTDF